jgi:thiol-disulfide isomerase/thioredoxin
MQLINIQTMKKIFFTLTFLSIYWISNAIERDFNIQISVKGMENQKGILAYNYGDKKFIADTLQFDQNGLAKINGKKDYEDGIYLMAFPTLDLRSFDFILRETNFQLSTDTSDLVGHLNVKNSTENQIMYDDLRKSMAISKKVDSLTKIASQENVSEKVKEKAREDFQVLNKAYTDERIANIEKNPQALYNKILNTLRDVPMEDKIDPATKTVDYNYYIHHYFDNVDFNDLALIKSPILLPRVFKFLDNIYQEPDSINHAIDIILKKASVNEESFKILSSEIINKYAKSNIMGQEGIYVYMIDNYYLNGKTPWVEQETLDKMKERADAMRPTLIGKTAPDITVYDMNNYPMNFYKAIDSNDYTILVFWNSECSHCKKEIPELLETWKDSLKQQYNVGVFSISTEVEKEHVDSFILEHHLNGNFINAYDPTGRSNFRKLYDVTSTPVVIILDKNKKIIAKKVAIKDLNYVISTYYNFEKNKAIPKNSSSK